MRVARDDAPVSWSAATRYAEPSASDAPFSARPSSPTFSPSSWRPSASLSWLPYNQLHWWSETPGRSPGGAAGAVPSDPARSRTDESRRCTAISGRVQQKRANVARDKAYVLGCGWYGCWYRCWYVCWYVCWDPRWCDSGWACSRSGKACIHRPVRLGRIRPERGSRHARGGERTSQSGWARRAVHLV